MGGPGYRLNDQALVGGSLTIVVCDLARLNHS